MKNNISLQSQRGFTLIELVIVLIVMGLVLGTLMNGMLLNKQRKDHQKTKDNLEYASHELLEFLKINQRLPCPAPKNINPKDFDGSESCEPGTLKGDMRYGLLPYKTLNMSSENAVDGWQDLLHYAVSDDLTNRDTFSAFSNKIIIYNEDLKPKYSRNYRVPYIVYSNGINRANSFTSQGVSVLPCNEYTLERENCDDDKIFIDAPLSFALTTRQSGANGRYTYFDDMLEYPVRIDDILEGGLLFYFEEKCPVGFLPVAESMKPSHVQYIYQTTEFSTNSFVLCQSINFNVSAMFETDKHFDLCPVGWVHVGYTQDYSMHGDEQGASSQNLCVK